MVVHAGPPHHLITSQPHFEIFNVISNFEINKTMNRVDILRNNIVDKLLTITNKDYLSALYQLIEKSSVDTDVVKLTEEQIVMLQLSDRDITEGKLISQDELDRRDLQWLKEL
jgi:hypothetical protein